MCCPDCVHKYTALRRLRGVILYELQATLATYARRKFSAGEISTDHMKNVMKVYSQNHLSNNNLSVKKIVTYKEKEESGSSVCIGPISAS